MAKDLRVSWFESFRRRGDEEGERDEEEGHKMIRLKKEFDEREALEKQKFDLEMAKHYQVDVS